MSGISFGGLASGLDTKTIIDQLMGLEARPKTLLENRRTVLNNTLSAFNGLRSLVSSLNTAATSIGNPLDWSAVAATSSDATRVAVRSGGTGTAGSVQISVTQLASQHAVASWGQTDLSTTQVAAGPITLSTSAGSTVVAVGGGTLQEVIDAINGQTAVGMRAAAVSTGSGQYKLQLTATNASETITTDPLQFGPLGPAWGTVSNAQQAIVHVGDPLSGYDITSNSNTITDIMPGVTIDLLQAGGAPITITSKTDTAKIADKVQAMVDAYNKVADDIKAKTKYDTTTKVAQPLFGHSSVRTSQRALADSVIGVDPAMTPYTVGIETTRDGKLTFDRSKFIAALESNPAGTQNLMISADPLSPGLVNRLKSAITTVNDVGNGLLKSGQDAADSQIKTLNDQIAAWDRRLVTRRSTLTRQFTQLETALGQLQARGNALAGALGGLSANSSG